LRFSAVEGSADPGSNESGVRLVRLYLERRRIRRMLVALGSTTSGRPLKARLGSRGRA